jgi:hypothetical protein
MITVTINKSGIARAITIIEVFSGGVTGYGTGRATNCGFGVVVGVPVGVPVTSTRAVLYGCGLDVSDVMRVVVIVDLTASDNNFDSSTRIISNGCVTTCTVLIMSASLSLICLISAMGSAVVTTTSYNESD